MNKKRSIAFALVFALMFGSCLSAFADTVYYTVTFYTDSTLQTVHETQQVEFTKHPAEPATVPASYTKDGFRYEFGGWYRTVGGQAYPFSFTDEEQEIWSDASIYAGYTQYLAEGYEMVVVYEGGTVFVIDTQTPVPELLARYGGQPQVTVKRIQETGDRLDADNDSKITPADASVFLKSHQPGLAAEVLKSIVG